MSTSDTPRWFTDGQSSLRRSTDTASPSLSTHQHWSLYFVVVLVVVVVVVVLMVMVMLLSGSMRCCVDYLKHRSCLVAASGSSELFRCANNLSRGFWSVRAHHNAVDVTQTLCSSVLS